MVYQAKIQNTDHLKERIRDACAHTSDVLKRVHHEWERRIRMCYQCNGAHVRHVLEIKRPFSQCIGTFESPYIQTIR
jgi:hypothetical protein